IRPKIFRPNCSFGHSTRFRRGLSPFPRGILDHTQRPLETGAGMNAPTAVFEHEGEEYVAVYSAGSVFAGAPQGDSVWLFSLKARWSRPLPRSPALWQTLRTRQRRISRDGKGSSGRPARRSMGGREKADTEDRL